MSENLDQTATQIEAQFQEAVKIVGELPSSGAMQVDTDTQLKMYSLFKQRNVGDINTSRPTGFMDFAGKKKWDSWSERKGMTKDDAAKEYVKVLREALTTSRGKLEEISDTANISMVDELLARLDAAGK